MIELVNEGVSWAFENQIVWITFSFYNFFSLTYLLFMNKMWNIKEIAFEFQLYEDQKPRFLIIKELKDLINVIDSIFI